MLSIRAPRQTAAKGASNGVTGDSASVVSVAGSGLKVLLSRKTNDVQGDEVVGDAHPGHSRREIVRRVVFPRLPYQLPELGEWLLIASVSVAGAGSPHACLGHTNHDLGASLGPHREYCHTQVAVDLQE